MKNDTTWEEIYIANLRAMPRPEPTEEQIKKYKEFKEAWVGRVFECINTGKRLTIPENVQERDFYSFGECFIDVGRWPYYSRMGGDIREITEEDKEV